MVRRLGNRIGRRSAALALAAGPLLAGPLAAQDSIPLDARVRVRHACTGTGPASSDVRSCTVTTGTLAFRQPGTLGISTGTGPPTAIPLPAITRLDLSTGSRSRAADGALIGAGVLGVAVLIAFATSPSGGEATSYAVPAGLLLVPVGAVLGALIGRSYRTDVWRTVDLDGR